jgi:FAD/FMN-containing dehydrogenase
MMTSDRTVTQYTSWGGLKTSPTDVLKPDGAEALRLPDRTWLAYGNGRSYGDSCFPAIGTLIDTRGMNRVLAFDEATGIIRAEAGLLIGDLIRHVSAKGWFPPVVPGTQHVTLGGALANDIHGKNHHTQGSFGTCVRAFEILRSDGSRQLCSPARNNALFCATIGGLGLTGFVTWVELQLMQVDSSDVLQEAVPLDELADFFRYCTHEKGNAPYSVAWIDSLAKGSALGRGVLLKGRHATDGQSEPLRAKARLGMPFTPPVSLINTLSLTAFNALYRRKMLANPGERRCSAGSFFFPLDAVGHWNRLYGRRGLRQHQCVIPLAKAEATIAAMLEVTHAAGQGSFLTVLKLFGSVPSPGYLSFPQPGATLTLDFAYLGARTDALLDTLDSMALNAGGRINPYKDAHMSAQTFSRSFPDVARFRACMDTWAQSAFAARVNLQADTATQRNR